MTDLETIRAFGPLRMNYADIREFFPPTPTRKDAQ